MGNQEKKLEGNNSPSAAAIAQGVEIMDAAAQDTAAKDVLMKDAESQDTEAQGAAVQAAEVQTVPKQGDEIDDLDYPGTGRVRIRNMEPKEMSQEDIDRILELTGQLEDFEILMMYYDCALAEVRTKLEVLHREVALKKNRNPFETIKSRLKKPVSIYEKLKARRIPFSVENIEKYLTDIAGLRVICSFIDDIYSIRDSLAMQDDVRIIQEKDYIAVPKPNGYRSLHLILEVPIYLMQEKKYMHVELQFRTIAMDFWASVEHQMKYKKEIRNAESIVEELHYSADLINQLDRRMLQIRDRIELNEEGDRVMSEWH
ncbi:MAG: GTP pyrophosphokinase family protein [Eubacteriales bacterium]|nr:GTP pyrophosphokinase family protein [Eubacteriales bacterium]